MLRTSALLSAISAAVTALALLNQVLTARTFGAGREFDIYLVAISIPFMVMGAATGAISQAFVPMLVTAQNSESQYRRSVLFLLLFTLGAAVVVVLIGFIMTLWFAAMMGGRYGAMERTQIVMIARVAWISAGISLLSSALTAVHHSEGSFALPAATNALPYVGMVAAMLVGPSSSGPVLLAWGMLAGTCVGASTLLPRTLRRIAWRSSEDGLVGSLLGGAARIVLVVTANCAFTGLALVDALVAPKFGSGALSFLGYSQRLIIALGGLVIAGPSVMLVPAIARAAAANDDATVASLARNAVFAVVMIATLISLIFYLIRVPIITLCLERGAFDSEMTRGVADTLPWMLVGSVAMLGCVIAFRILYGQNSRRLPAVIGVVTPALYLVLSVVFSRFLGFQGICVAYATCWWTALLVLIPRFSQSPSMTAADLCAPVGALVIAGLGVWIGRELLLDPGLHLGSLALAFRCCVVGGTGLILFTVMTAFLWPVPQVRALLARWWPLQSGA